MTWVTVLSKAVTDMLKFVEYTRNMRESAAVYAQII
jgi:hypothetical protein